MLQVKRSIVVLFVVVVQSMACWAADPTATVAATDATAKEAALDTGKFRITLSAAAAAATTINFTRTGTATNATDYNNIPLTATVAAGATFVDVTVTPIQDTTYEGNETVILTLTAGTGYVVGGTNTATVNLIDNDVTLTIAATDATASEPGTDTGNFRITLSNPAPENLSVIITRSGTGANGTDYTAINSPIAITAGATTKDVVVTPQNDSNAENNETVTLTLGTSTTYTVGTPNAATVTISDDDPPTITASATDATAKEAALNTGTVRFTLNAAARTALTVNYSIAGTATNGTDYNNLTGTASVAVGATFVDVVVTPIQDTTYEGNETIILTVIAGTDYVVGGTNAATVNLIENDITLSIAATDASASEPGTDTGNFRITLSNPAPENITVTVARSGSATNASDYTSISTSVSVTAGATTQDVVVTPLDNTTGENNETVILTLSASTSYTVGTPNAATVTIYDEDPAVVSITATDASAAEPSGNNGNFRITRAGNPANALTVNYTLSGTATNGTDYTSLPGSKVINAGAATADISLSVLDDTFAEGSEVATATVAAGAGYTIGGSPANITITDNEPVLTVAATPANVIEGTTTQIIFTVTRAGVLTSALTVPISFSGTATPGSDYATPPTQVVIPANAPSATVAFNLTDDSTSEPDETVILTLQAGTGYTVGTPASATVAIEDRDQTFVSVTATDASAIEPGTDTGTFTFTRIGNRTAAITVNFTVAGTATSAVDYTALSTSVNMAANAASATVTVTPLNNTGWAPVETVDLTLANGIGYTIAAPTAATVNIADEEQPQLVIPITAFSLREGANATAQVKLSTSLEANVGVKIDATRISGRASFNPVYLIFNQTNATTDQPILIEALQSISQFTGESRIRLSGSPVTDVDLVTTITDTDDPQISSILLRPDSFDAAQFSSNAQYRSDYLAKLVPARIHLSATPGASVPILKASGSTRLNLPYPAGGDVSVIATANAPVTFFLTGEGYFNDNKRNCITVQADGTGLAKVSFGPPSTGSRSTILVASPSSSGLVRFVVTGIAP